MAAERIVVRSVKSDSEKNIVQSQKSRVTPVARRLILPSPALKSSVAVLVLGAGALLNPLQAQVSAGTAGGESEMAVRPPDILNAADGGFRRGLQEVGLGFGAGFSAHKIGDTTPHDLVLSRIYYGIMLGDLKAKDHWYRGNWEFRQEFFAGDQFHPNAHYLVGETTVFRYNFATGTRWVPFIDGGAGVLATDIGPPDLGSVFEFNEQLGPGVDFFWRKNSALTFQYRYTHISNAGIKEPNQGLNVQMFYVGLSWYF